MAEQYEIRLADKHYYFKPVVASSIVSYYNITATTPVSFSFPLEKRSYGSYDDFYVYVVLHDAFVHPAIKYSFNIPYEYTVVDLTSVGQTLSHTWSYDTYYKNWKCVFNTEETRISTVSRILPYQLSNAAPQQHFENNMIWSVDDPINPTIISGFFDVSGILENFQNQFVISPVDVRWSVEHGVIKDAPFSPSTVDYGRTSRYLMNDIVMHYRVHYPSLVTSFYADYAYTGGNQPMYYNGTNPQCFTVDPIEI